MSRAAATLGMSRETVRLAGGVDATVDRAVELASGRDETALEVALGLATDATRVAREEARHATLALQDGLARVDTDVGDAAPGSGACAGSGARADAREGVAHPERQPELDRLRDASRLASLASTRANEARRDIRGRLHGRLIEDEWRAIVASVASSDFRRDRKKPRVRARDRRCNQPKARQGWDKKSMRDARVRVCAGCDRMLPAAELVRVVRVVRDRESQDDDGTRAKGSARVEDERVEPTTPTKKKTKKKKRDAASRVVVLDVSSLLPGAGAETLAASVAPGGPFAAVTEAHPAATRAATTLASGASGDAPPPPRRGVTRLSGRAAYVCRRGHCARAVVKAKTLRRHLRVSPGGGDASSAQRFHDALVGVCDAAEALDGVDSSGWAFAREPGTPSRWKAHPVCLDAHTGLEVASERAKRLAVGGSGPDEDAAAPAAPA